MPPVYIISRHLIQGFKIFILLILILKIFRICIGRVFLTNIIDAANTIYFIISFLAIFFIFREVFIGWWSGVEYEQYAFIGQEVVPLSVLIGGYLLNNILIPQLFWFSKLRKAFACSLLVIGFDILFRIIGSIYAGKFPNDEFNLTEIVLSLCYFTPLLSIVYSIKTKLTQLRTIS